MLSTILALAFYQLNLQVTLIEIHTHNTRVNTHFADSGSVVLNALQDIIVTIHFVAI